MTPTQQVVLTLLWFLAAILALLLGMVYRQVDRAYRSDTPTGVVGLPVDAQLPSIAVLDGSRELELSFGDAGPVLIVILSSTCGACEALVDVFLDDPIPQLPKLFIVTEGPGPAELQNLRAHWDAWTASHAGDLIRDYAVTAVPLVYVGARGRVLAVGTPTSRRDVLNLVDAAAGRYGEGWMTLVGTDPHKSEDRR